MKILFATDCSDYASAAAEFLNALKFTAPLDVTIITALGDPYGASPESTEQWFPDLVREEKTRAEMHQAKISDLLSARCRSVDRICQSGHPVKVILAQADQMQCDLIVIGAQGHSMLGRLLIGSVSDSVATHAKCSVLIVRPQESDPQHAVGVQSQSESNRLLIGYDSSAASRQAVEEILALNWSPQTEIKLLSVAPIYDYLLGNGLSAAAIANEEEVFNEMKQGGKAMEHRISESFPNTESIITHGQRVGDAIVDLAAKNNSELVVIGDSGHSLLDDFLLGSTSKYVLRHAGCSVWISRRHRQPD
ncbi:universal stress protein [Stieleria sp. TO1_6]|uniref:universal stress protein n=1 Tax=Stieleria tagensis TaxID=2956795 RepID=UPI00209B18BE|nr:universal stress protein [Stieleria tagensis]MCO8122092.1 universal stress protein [Stieleria tagensis]